MKKGDIYLVDIPTSGNGGHEQGGFRPAVVVGKTTAGIVPVVPLTSNPRATRFKHTVAIRPNDKNNLEAQSVALVFHARAIDKRRLTKRIGILQKEEIDRVDRKLRSVFKLSYA